MSNDSIPTPTDLARESESARARRHFPAALHFARVFGRRHPRLDRDDLVSACLAGLAAAARGFDPDRGAFTTHLFWCCRRHVSTLLRSGRPKGFRGPEDPRAAPRTLSLDAARGFAGPGGGARAVDDADELRHLLRGLPPHLRVVVGLVYLEGLTLEQAGLRLGVSKEWVRRLRDRALLGMREWSEASAPGTGSRSASTPPARSRSR